MVLGHEGVGIVEEVGPDAKYLKKGDRVGFGYEHDSCGHCRECLTGNETYCVDRAIYGTEKVTQGSFASYAVVRESFLHEIPEGMSDIDAAPLQCAGATVFAALRAHDTQPTETIGGKFSFSICIIKSIKSHIADSVRRSYRTRWLRTHGDPIRQ